jgi:hypothetical protein
VFITRTGVGSCACARREVVIMESASIKAHPVPASKLNVILFTFISSY